MNRSNTVRASFVIIVIWLLGFMAGIIPDNTLLQSVPWMIFGLLLLAALLRLFVLFWQTLVHAVQARSLGWVVGHFFLGPIASAAYYLAIKAPPVPAAAGTPGPVAVQGLRNRDAEQGGAGQPATRSDSE